MNYSALQAVGIDYEDGIRRFGGNAHLYEKYLMQFAQDEHYEKMQQAFAQQDWAAMLFHAHTLKGLAGNLSMAPLFAALTALVNALRQNQTDAAPALVHEISLQYAQMLAVLC